MSLSGYSEEQLKAELERRAKVKKDKPEPLTVQDWQPVEDMCVDYIRQLSDDGYVDDDLKHYIFEGAMTATFGLDIWSYIRELKR